MRLRVGEALFDGEARELRVAGEPVPIGRKAFDLLALLLAARPRVVTKEEIHEALWPRTFVVESNVQGLVRDVRKALGDDARAPRLVRTVWGIGYAFAGEAFEEPPAGAREPERPAAPACLVRGTHRVPLPAGATLLGRDAEPAAAFADVSVSRRHARVLVEGGRAAVEDLGSKNGTFVDGARIEAPTPLRDGAEVRLGLASFTFRSGPGDEPTKTVG